MLMSPIISPSPILIAAYGVFAIFIGIPLYTVGERLRLLRTSTSSKNSSGESLSLISYDWSNSNYWLALSRILLDYLKSMSCSSYSSSSGSYMVASSITASW